MSQSDKTTPVVLEVGKRWVFASALAWPGWCRRAKTPDEAIAALTEYEARYRLVAGATFVASPFDIVGRATGNATTDFGAPGIVGPWDDPSPPSQVLDRLLGVLARCWEAFDEAVARSPAELRRGPRGGGRDRDAIVEHTREAERAYCSKAGIKVPPRTPWSEQRSMLLAGLAAGRVSDTSPAHWPGTYTIRRVAWHVTDHMWEIEDRRIG